MNIPSIRSKRRARIEIIPLIDIVFFLLATFVMVSLSMVRNYGVDVHLPSASSGSRQIQNEQYTAISINQKGDVFFNRTPIKLEELSAKFKALKAKEKDPTVVLNADEKAMFGKAVYVLDQARKQDIKKVALMAQTVDAEK